MDINRDNFTVLMADDDADDFFLLKEGLIESQIDCDLRRVPDGEELMHYLLKQGRFIDHEPGPLPLFILLDLNMPGKNGRDVLVEIKSIPELKHIPVIMYTSSRDDEDVRQCYALGASSYINKPVERDQLIHMIMNLFSYWTRTVMLPEAEFIASPKNANRQGAEKCPSAM
jgi:CheY-like chemotaxis protein